MKIIANELRTGHIIEYQNSLWSISKNPEHIKPGKGGAYVQVEMKNLYDLKKSHQRFNSHQYVERAYVEEKKAKYLYDISEEVVFIDDDNLEEIKVPKSKVGHLSKFLLLDVIFIIRIFRSKIIDLLPPAQVAFVIKETEVFMKSYRESPSYKSAITENGVHITVPSYINNGNKVLVSTEDMRFIEKLC